MGKAVTSYWVAMRLSEWRDIKVGAVIPSDEGRPLDGSDISDVGFLPVYSTKARAVAANPDLTEADILEIHLRFPKVLAGAKGDG